MSDHRLTLRDGRTLAFAVHDDASPVIFFAGAGCGRRMAGPPFVRGLVTFDRPGLGASTHDAQKSFASIVDDVRELVDALTALRSLANPATPASAPAAIANSQGAPFALACAAAGVFSSLTLVSPVDEVAYPPIFEQLPPPMQELVELAALDPVSAHAVFHGFTADALYEFVLRAYPESDAAVYGDPAFVAMYRAALADGFAPGGEGYAADTVLAMRPWNLALDRIAIPVRILYGADDAFHSPDNGEVLASRIPSATRTIVDDVGGSLLWSPRLATVW